MLPQTLSVRARPSTQSVQVACYEVEPRNKEQQETNEPLPF
jgi:hypothetical protein